jgi:enoyl-CoA hydratase/carnithine racemase
VTAAEGAQTISELTGGDALVSVLSRSGGLLRPFVLLDLDVTTDVHDLRMALQTRPSGDGVLVGLCRGEVPSALRPLTALLDVTLVPAGCDAAPELVGVPDPDGSAAELAAAVRDAPHAAAVLAGLLRWTGDLPVPAALDAESLAYSTLLGGPEFGRWLDRRGRRPPPPPAVDPVLVDRFGDQLFVTLNRPERRNAFGRELRDQLVSVLQLAALDDTVEQVVLVGAGPSFCSGGDLDEFGTTPDLVTAHLVRTRGGAGRLLHRLESRTEVRLHGACVGAGIELPAFAGLVLADRGASFRLPEIGMGLIPGAGGTVSIPRRIGRWRTLYMAISGTAVDVPTALRWGLVDATTEAETPTPGV